MMFEVHVPDAVINRQNIMMDKYLTFRNSATSFAVQPLKEACATLEFVLMFKAVQMKLPASITL